MQISKKYTISPYASSAYLEEILKYLSVSIFIILLKGKPTGMRIWGIAACASLTFITLEDELYEQFMLVVLKVNTNLRLINFLLPFR